jgi:Cd2+/Zn2+-exporting ATPase
MINTDPNHRHTYDAKGNMTCCSLDEKIDSKSGRPHLHAHNDAHDHEGHDSDDGHDHGHEHEGSAGFRNYIPAMLSFALLLTGLLFDYAFMPPFFTGNVRLAWYIAAYLPVGLPVMRDAFISIRSGAFFSEFFLMSLAATGAFFIREYSEAVAVMLFYAIGELFQTAAVNRAKGSIRALLDIRPDIVSVSRNGIIESIPPSDAGIGEIMQVKPGERVALDGELVSGEASFNTSALTGESRPDTKRKGETVLAGMINLNTLADIKVTALFRDSKLSGILEMVRDAAAHKSQTQLFISGFARIYTPAVVLLAIAICLLPAVLMPDYEFSKWLYRALVFLVISCPCALVISIPLGYFGGIGLASKNGILFKGSDFLDVMARINTVVMDKTGTLTKGVFRVQEIRPAGISEDELLRVAAALESKSTHPIALAIMEHAGNKTGDAAISRVEEIPGHGLKGSIDGKEVLAGNLKLLQMHDIRYDMALDKLQSTIVAVAINGKYAGCILIADEIRKDAAEAIGELNRQGIMTVMLSGDKQGIVTKVAETLKISSAYGDLLPEHKVLKLQALKDAGRITAFVGDGINDAPAIALADAGIAMGGLGSDAAVETADIVIQNDSPSSIVKAIRIGRITRRIVWQNIALAMGVKLLVLAMGAGGIATLWEAVFADVGVALLAILNAVRVQRIKV